MVREALIALTVGAGCTYRVAVKSLPTPAIVELPNGERITTPGVARLRWSPYNRQVATVTANGYRPLQVDLRQNEVKFGRFIGRMFRRGPRGEVEFILVPAHGPAGTWSESDVPR